MHYIPDSWLNDNFTFIEFAMIYAIVVLSSGSIN